MSRAMSRGRTAGLTLLEIVVSIAIISMVALLIYGAVDSMNRAKKGESLRIDRARQGREAILRIVRDMSSAYLSMHGPQNQSLATRLTAFQGKSGASFSRVDFTAFAHRRMVQDAKESDQAEVSYFVASDPEASEKMDLVRREQTPVDMDPRKGGVVNVLAENVEKFELKYLDGQTGSWTDRWDSSQTTGQPGRLPLEVRVALTMKAVPGAPSRTYTAKFMIPIQQPLTFGVSQ